MKSRPWFGAMRDGPAGDPMCGILSAWLPLAITTACAQDAPSPPAAAVTDSAGVRFVHLGDAPFELAERRVVASEPDLVIRSSEDDIASVLADVRDVEVLPRGRIAAVNGRGNEILLFDSSGERVATWGGTGSGRGEFRGLEWLAHLPPDTLAAGDHRLRGVTAFDAAGRCVRSFSMADAVNPASNPIPPRPMGLLADGSTRSSASLAAVTEELLEAWIGERYRDATQSPALEELKQDQRDIVRHTTTPSFGRIVGMTDGGVAVGEFGLGTASPRRWIAVDPGGTVAVIELPAGFDVKRWGRNRVVGVVRDALDREEIHRYRNPARRGFVRVCTTERRSPRTVNRIPPAAPIHTPR